jgi:hypothetical protein
LWRTFKQALVSFRGAGDNAQVPLGLGELALHVLDVAPQQRQPPVEQIPQQEDA